jgi:hypothetical protein
MSNSTPESVLSTSAGLQTAFRYRFGQRAANDRLQESAREALGAQSMVRHPITWQNSSEIGPILAGLALDKLPKGLTCKQWCKAIGYKLSEKDDCQVWRARDFAS